MSDFFNIKDFDSSKIKPIINDALCTMDDGELFIESLQSEGFLFDGGYLKNSSYNSSAGFGLRAVIGEITGYAHSSDFTEEALKKAVKTVSAIKKGYCGEKSLSSSSQILKNDYKIRYNPVNPLEGMLFSEKVSLLSEIDSYLRAKSNLVKQVTISLSGSLQNIEIIRIDSNLVKDTRPLVRMNISCVVEKNDVMGRGSHGMGGRELYNTIISPDVWKAAADDALRIAMINVEAKESPAGEMPVVLGNGWPGVLLHEAVGHGLEGDFNRKKTSTYSDLVGQKVASSCVTIIDDGTIKNKRGSLNIDDEGTPTQKNILVENGILKGYMQDRLNARLMNVNPTGNGRRESYECQPMPRMTNTYMGNGKHDKEEIISSVDKGIYAVNFEGGQVDITSGKFVFSSSEAYMIESGKVTYPIKGVTLIGDGPNVMNKVEMVGNDLSLDAGTGTCGKQGQSVPVCVGQPTILIGGLTVGGTSI